MLARRFHALAEHGRKLAEIPAGAFADVRETSTRCKSGRQRAAARGGFAAALRTVLWVE